MKMTKEQIIAEVDKNIKKYKIKIISGTFGVTSNDKGRIIPTHKNECCFIGAFELGKNKIFADYLSLSETYVRGFTAGFDNIQYNYFFSDDFKEGYQFGKEMREKYICQ